MPPAAASAGRLAAICGSCYLSAVRRADTATTSGAQVGPASMPIDDPAAADSWRWISANPKTFAAPCADRQQRFEWAGCAGGQRGALPTLTTPIAEISAEEFDRVTSTSLRGAPFGCRLLAVIWANADRATLSISPRWRGKIGGNRLRRSIMQRLGRRHSDADEKCLLMRLPARRRSRQRQRRSRPLARFDLPVRPRGAVSGRKMPALLETDRDENASRDSGGRSPAR